MVYGLWLSAGGLLAQQYRQAIIANNLANAETPGYKSDRIAFRERLAASVAGGVPEASHSGLNRMTGGVFETPVYTDYSQGGFVPSESSLDLAIDGNGFLTVRTPDGPRYTRDGRLMVDLEGTLRHLASGGVLLDQRGQPIVVDRSSPEKITIDDAGQVRQGEHVAGRLGLVDFEDRQKLEKVGHDLYAADRARRMAATGRIRPFGYEASGVDPVATLVEMIAATRAYELNATMISLQDGTIGRAVNEVGRLG